jgi:hypothetical protein
MPTADCIRAGKRVVNTFSFLMVLVLGFIKN